MYDERTNLGQQVARDVRGFFKDKVFRTVIPRNVRLGEAPSHGVPGVVYDARSRGAEAYFALAHEVITRGHRSDRRLTRGAVMEKRFALGKGLSALIPDAPVAGAAAPAAGTRRRSARAERVPAAAAPRRGAGSTGLAASIRANGVVQPVVVRRVGADRYQIIAGERRWRAAQRAGLTRVPVVVKDVPPGGAGQLLEWALIENLQREDLNPIEEAAAYQRLVAEFHLSHDDSRDARRQGSIDRRQHGAAAQAGAGGAGRSLGQTRCRWATRGRWCRCPATPISAASPAR